MNELQTAAKGEVSITDESLYNSFLNYLDVRPKSTETYRTAIKQFLKYLIENGITNPTRENIIAYRDYLHEHH